VTTDLEAADAQQQAAVTALAPLYVPACPGAGKTHVIVSRHLSAPAGRLRQGRALISFTRTARDQMAERCRAEGRAEMAAFPNFIGTMDSFLWEFLVLPYLPGDRTWRLFDSWSALRADVQQPDRKIPLDAFTFTYDPQTGVESVPEDKLDESAARTRSGSKFPWWRWEREAKRVRDNLKAQGYLTCHETRVLALEHLRERADEVLAPLRSRFAEIMVDEAQDCSKTEIAILETFHAADLKLTVVGDPDQMIYGWREADRQSLAELTAKFDSRIELTGNRRSTSTICALAATLRTGIRPPDLSITAHQDDHAVLILPTNFKTGAKSIHLSGTDTVTVFTRHAQELGIPPESCLITARHRRTLPIPRAQRGGNQITRLARASEVVRSGSGDAAKVEQACRTAASVLLAYWYPDFSGSIEAICSAQQLLASELLRRGYAFLSALPQPHAGWSADVYSLMKSFPRPVSARPQGTRGRLAGNPDVAAKGRASTQQARMDNVHQVKGDQADAVLVMLPEEDTTERWRESDPADDEELRIFFVAVTRARRLLGLAARVDQADKIASLLNRAGVPHRVI
jgi:DNA helicase II / ATP-dependent DNA helicase PcrA